MKILKETEKFEKRISKYIYKVLKIPKEVKRFVEIEYSTYHREIRVLYNSRYIGKVDSNSKDFVYSTDQIIENIIKDYASKLALKNLKEQNDTIKEN
jgi:hypothetical protein